jgi:hypothetical protein
MRMMDDDDIERLHQTYRRDDLYRYWSATLSELELKWGLPNQVVVWYHSDRLIDKLRNVGEDPQSEIAYLFNKFLTKCRMNAMVSATVNPGYDRPMAIAQEVFALAFVCLANAVEKGHEHDDIANDEICVTIWTLLHNSMFFNWLLEYFRRKKKDSTGNPIHITPSDPMKKAQLDTQLPSEQDEVKKLYSEVMRITRPLNDLLSEDNQRQWQDLWHRITDDEHLRGKLRQPTPQSHRFGDINGKMICNVLGMFRNNCCQNIAVSKMNKSLDHGNVTSYIRNFTDEGSDSVVDKNERRKIETFIKG